MTAAVMSAWTNGKLHVVVGPAGLLVEPRDPARLAVALRTLWADDALYAGIRAAARERAIGERRTWADVADATRRVYAAVGAYPVPERHAATDGDEEAAGA